MDELAYAIDTIDGSPFEDLATDYLRVEGFDVHESGIKGKDGGWDARVEADDRHGIAHASTRNDWERKIRSDAESVRELEADLGEDYDLFVFVTNQDVNGTEELRIERELESEYGWTVQIFHRQNILSELRANAPELAKEHLGVEIGNDRDHLEDILELREDRLQTIRERTGVAEDLQEGPTTVLHVIPNSVFSNDKHTLSGDPPNPPILCELPLYRTEAGGKSVFARYPELKDPMEAYGEIRNNGLYETVTTRAIFEGQDGRFISTDVSRGGPGLDATTVITVRHALSALSELGVNGTVFVSLSLLDASGTRLPKRNRGFGLRGGGQGVQSDQYSTEPVAVTIGSDRVIADVEPILSEIWRELGKEHGTENIEDGKWVGGPVRLNHETLLEPATEDESH